MYRLLVILLVALPQPTDTGQANLSWTPPTLNDDGSPLTDLASYEIWHGCSQSGSYDTVEIVLAPATTHIAAGLPDTGTCYFAAKATNSVGASGVFSNEASKFMGQAILPGVVNDTEISWQESIGTPMDISRAALTDDFSATDGTVFTTASITPSANKLILLYISGRPSGSTPTAIVTGNGLTWVLVNGEDTSVRYSALYRAMGASPSSGAVTITFSLEMRNATWEISEFDFVDTSGTNGSGAIVQSVRDTASAATSITPTLAAFADATNNATYMGATHRDHNNAMTPEAGFTELSDNSTGEQHVGAAQWRIGEDVSPTYSWSGSAGAVAVACEIKAAVGLTVNMGLVTETALAQSLGKAKARAIGLTTEADLAQPLVTTQSINIGLVSESDVSQAFSALKQRAIGLLTEANLAQVFSKSKSKQIGLTSESDLSQPFGKAKSKVIGLVSETELAQTLAASKALAIGIITETELAQAIGTAKAKAIGLLSETDQVFAFDAFGLTVNMGLVLETDIVQTIGKTKDKAIGLLTETDLASAVSSAKSTPLGLITEFDIPFALGTAKLRLIGLIAELDASLAFAVERGVDIGLLLETDTVFAMSAAKALSLGLVSESDIVFSMSTAPIILVTNLVQRDARFQVRLRRDGLFTETLKRDSKFAQSVKRDAKF